ncbi:MAG: hypothetical protein KAQ89_00500 [Planctomycetes bacterium]|nr:hypothetical protein [Planctomycetota bacterium]
MNNPKELNQKTNNYFWAFAGLLCILLISIMARSIDRPFIGLHSWARAGDAWRARAFLNYDLEYTKGFSVWAVGNPPTENSNRSLDHPQFGLFTPALDMVVFGCNVRATRIGRIIRVVFTLLMFLVIVRRLTDDKTALLAGLFFVILPLTSYFGVRAWMTPMAFVAIWSYLTIIGEFKNKPPVKKIHQLILALSLFLIIQLSWEGFFYAMAIGIHYVFRCLHKKQFPQKSLLAILIIAPFSSMALNFIIMAAGFDWNWQKIVELYQWRSGGAEMEVHNWSRWFARLWEHSVNNFTIPVLIITFIYFTLGQLIIFVNRTNDSLKHLSCRQFPQFWFFLMPGIFQIFLLKGALWWHQYWETPLMPFVAIATALPIMLMTDILNKISTKTAKAAFVLAIGVLFIFCVRGTNYYYDRIDFPMKKVELFKMLNSQIPPDKQLLSFESFIRTQNKVKGPHYRPEIAWYLDRDITVAQSVEAIKQKAKTGKYPYYLMPLTRYDRQMSAYLSKLSSELRKSYNATYIDSEPSSPGKVGMPSYMVFNLKERKIK